MVLLPYRNGYLLRWMDDMSLFDSSPHVTDMLMNYPGGVLQFAGSYLTQFMFHPWIGSLLLMAIWACSVFLAIKAFRLRGYATLLALSIPLILLISILNIDVAWLTIPSKGYIFSQSIGAALSLSLFLVYRLSKSFAIRCLTSAIMLASFPLFGFYSLLAWMMSAVYETIEAFTERSFKRLSIVAAGLALAIIIPQIYYSYWRGTWTERDGIYLKGLPDFPFSDGDLYQWMPFIILTGALLLLTSFPFIKASRLSSRKTLMAGIAILTALAGWSAAVSTKTEQFRALVLMQRAMQANDWNKVVAIISNCRQPPSYEMAVIANFAGKMLGRQTIPLPSEDSADNENGRNKNVSFTRTALLTVPLSYYIGHTNLSYRWAMEHTVKFGPRAFFIKYMTKCALVNGDIKLAEKYNDMLRSTLFHHEWAERYQPFIDNPSLMKDDPEFAAIPENTSREIFFGQSPH